MLVMFTFLSYLLFKPLRKLLEDRKQRVADEQESAKNDRKEAAVYKEEYEQKLKEIDKEAQAILSEARKKAMKTENEIVAEAKKKQQGSSHVPIMRSNWNGSVRLMI